MKFNFVVPNYDLKVNIFIRIVLTNNDMLPFIYMLPIGDQVYGISSEPDNLSCNKTSADTQHPTSHLIAPVV